MGSGAVHPVLKPAYSGTEPNPAHPAPERRADLPEGPLPNMPVPGTNWFALLWSKDPPGSATLKRKGLAGMVVPSVATAIRFSMTRECCRMEFLILGLALFLAIHLLPAAPALRAGLREQLGPGLYRLGFSVVSLAGVVLLAAGMARADYIALWPELPYGRELAPVLMAAAVLFLVAAYVPGNLRRVIRHPMLWGIVLWAVAHLLVAGHVAALLLFGGLGGYALFVMLTRKARPAWQTADSRSWFWDLLTLAVAAVLYGLLLWAHPHLFGVSVL